MLSFASLKPSTVLGAMVLGLLKSENDPLFELNMGTHGSVRKEMCYGSCSTLALAELFGGGKLASEMMLAYIKTQTDNLGSTNAPLSKIIQADDLSVTDSPLSQVFEFESFSTNLQKLEHVVNHARSGNVSRLIEFLTGKQDESFNGRWELRSNDWKEQLPKVKETTFEMLKAGY